MIIQNDELLAGMILHYVEKLNMAIEAAEGEGLKVDAWVEEGHKRPVIVKTSVARHYESTGCSGGQIQSNRESNN